MVERNKQCRTLVGRGQKAPYDGMFFGFYSFCPCEMAETIL